MNSLAGKSTGIALLMAAALLAALFSMGVFSAGTVGAHDPTNTTDGGHDATSPTHGAQHDELSASGIVIAFQSDGAVAPIIPDEGNTVSSGTTALDENSTPAFNFNADGHSYEIEVLPQWSALYLTATGDTDVAESEVTVSVNGEELDAYQQSREDSADNVALEAATVGAVVYVVDLTGDVVNKIEVTADDADNDQAAGVYTIDVNHDSPTNSSTAGAAVRLTLEANIAVDENGEFTIAMPSFGVPSSIDVDDVTISRPATSGATGTNYRGNPADVAVSGTTLTLTFADDDDEDTPVADSLTTDVVTTISIRQQAGITNPTKAGRYGIKINDKNGDHTDSDDAVDAQNVATVIRTVSVNPDSAASGDDITITGKGFTDGTATVYIDVANHVDDDNDSSTPASNDDLDTANSDTPVRNMEFDDNDTVLGSAPIDDGSFTLVVVAGEEFSSDDMINAIDSNDDEADSFASFSLDSSVSVSPSEVSVAEEISISVSDWPTPRKITVVRIGQGPDLLAVDDEKDVASDGSATVTITIPDGTRPGSHRVTVQDNMGEKKTVTISVDPLDLEVSPASAVANQQITIQGSDFEGDDHIKLINVGKVEACSSNGTPANNCGSPSSSGNIVLTILVPDNAASGDQKITVESAAGRVGEVDFTVPLAAITLDPATSRRGTTVTVNGTGFPATDLILIQYPNPDTNKDQTVSTSQTDSTGAFTGSFSVPSFAKINASAKVKAVSSVNDKDVSATADHSLPDSMLTVDPAAVTSGDNVTITGQNMAVYASISNLTIGGVQVTPVPAPSTDVNGSFTATVLVPQLELGNARVSVTVSGRTTTTFVDIVAAAASQAPADLFADLIEAGALDRIFLYNNETQEWFLYDPDPGFEAANTLDMLNPGNIIWIQLKEAAEVQGTNLLAGWSLITVQ